MRVDFYQLTRDPAEAVLPLIARNTLAAGERLLVVSDDAAQRARLSEALWTRLPESFLAHGEAGGPQDDRQPILLSSAIDPANGARYVALADGQWRAEVMGERGGRGGAAFTRAFLLFDDTTIAAARSLWRELKPGEPGSEGGLERHFWRQDGGKWQEVA